MGPCLRPRRKAPKAGGDISRLLLILPPRCLVFTVQFVFIKRGDFGFLPPFPSPGRSRAPPEPAPKQAQAQDNFCSEQGAQRAVPLVSDVAGGGEARRAVCERFPAPTCRKELGNRARLPNPPGSCLPALQAPGTAACPSRKPPPEPLILINQSPPEVLFFPELPLRRAVEAPKRWDPWFKASSSLGPC